MAVASSFDFLGCGHAPIPMDEAAVLEAPMINTTMEPKRIDQRAGAVVPLRCNPPEKVERALEVILNHPRVASAAIIDAAGTVNVLIGDQRMRSYTTVFDKPPEWTMEWLSGGETCMGSRRRSKLYLSPWTQTLSPAGQCEEMSAHNQNPLLSIPGVTKDFVKELDMTEEEQTNIPFLTWYYGQLGANLFDPMFAAGKKFFFMFTVNMLYDLGYYTTTYPGQILNSIAADGRRVIKMTYQEAFDKSDLLGGEGVVVNPLRYRPAGDQVVFIQDIHMLSTLGQCISPKARALNSLICRFVGLAIRTAAVNHAKAVGRAEHEARVVNPANEALERSIRAEKIHRLEAEKNMLKALKRASDYKAEIETTKRLALEFKGANRAVPTRFTINDNTPRTGCAGVYVKKNPNEVEVSMHYTDMRSVGDVRHTLKKSVNTLSSRKDDRSILLKLLGGTRMIDLRSNYDDAFNVIGCPPVEMPNEGAVWDALENGLFMDRASKGFAMGLGWKPDDEGVRHMTVEFTNELIVDGMPTEDRKFLENLAGRAGP